MAEFLNGKLSIAGPAIEIYVFSGPQYSEVSMVMGTQSLGRGLKFLVHKFMVGLKSP
jgi:hypothetical protein